MFQSGGWDPPSDPGMELRPPGWLLSRGCRGPCWWLGWGPSWQRRLALTAPTSARGLGCGGGVGGGAGGAADAELAGVGLDAVATALALLALHALSRAGSQDRSLRIGGRCSAPVTLLCNTNPNMNLYNLQGPAMR